MDFLFLIKYGELSLKGNNRKSFEKVLFANIRSKLKGFNINLKRLGGSLLVTLNADSVQDMLLCKDILVNKVFGIRNLAVVRQCENNFSSMLETVLNMIEENNLTNASNFRIKTKRSNKDFELTSPEVSCLMGSKILEKYPLFKVKLKNPEMIVNIEIMKKYTYIYVKKENCIGGMPVSTSGRVGLLLSGGIDSPVAGYLTQKRGCFIDCIYFHSPPHTSQKAKEKVLSLAKKLKEYQKNIRVFVVNFTEIQIMLKKKTKESYFVILSRRMMMRIANEIALKYQQKALITGENLGQVASQTLENLHCTNTLAKLPVLRPLVCYDKEDIIKIARKIETFDISILPYDDCCTLFLPRNPSTKANVNVLESEESNVDVQSLVDRALSTIELIRL